MPIRSRIMSELCLKKAQDKGPGLFNNLPSLSQIEISLRLIILVPHSIEIEIQYPRCRLTSSSKPLSC